MTADTQNPGGWPDAARPGVPQNSERDGWHWLHHPEDLRHVPTPWDAAHAAWCSGGMHSPQGVVDLGYRYLGPCLTPAEVAAREAAAALAMREAIVGWHDELARVTDDPDRAGCHRWCGHMIPKLAVHINGADALAAREAAARREGIEAASALRSNAEALCQDIEGLARRFRALLEDGR